MRTTVELDPDVEALLKEKATALGVSLDEAGSIVLRSVLSSSDQPLVEVNGAHRAASTENKADYNEFAFRSEINDGVDVKKPGIYEWIIEGRGSYIGRYTNISRPRKEYLRNVNKLLRGERYHIQGRDFRSIHYELRDAHLDGRAIRLILLENCDPDQLNLREQALIHERGVLNRRGQKRVKA